MKKLLYVALLVSSLSFSQACKRAVPLYQPSFQVQAKNTAQVRDAIKKVLQRRRWIIENSGSNFFVARYDRGTKYSATVRIDYTGSTVKVTRVKSRGLLYEQGPDGEIIHKTYNGWMRNLERDIELELSYM